MKKFSFLIACLLLLAVSACEQPKSGGGNGNDGNDTTSTSGNDSTPETYDVTYTTPIPENMLYTFLQAQSFGSKLDTAMMESGTNDIGSATSVYSVIPNESSKTTMIVSVASFGLDIEFENFISGRGFPQGKVGMILKDQVSEVSAFQGFDLLQISELNAFEMSQLTQEKALEFVQMTDLENKFGTRGVKVKDGTLQGQGGSYLRALRTEKPDVAGWELFDQANKVGMLIFAYKDRTGLVMTCLNIKSNKTLLKILNNMDFSMMDELLAKFSKDKTVTLTDG